MGLLENGSIVVRTVAPTDNLLSYSLVGEQVLPLSAFDARFWENEGILWGLVQPFDAEGNRLVGYFGALRGQNSEVELSYDELIERARKELRHQEAYAFTGVPHPM